MFFAYVLVIWACLGAISAAIHMLFVFRSLSGREGTESLAVTVEHAARAGGRAGGSRAILHGTSSCPGLPFRAS